MINANLQMKRCIELKMETPSTSVSIEFNLTLKEKSLNQFMREQKIDYVTLIYMGMRSVKTNEQGVWLTFKPFSYGVN